MGNDITPTLISRCSTAIGNTQDKLNVITVHDASRRHNYEAFGEVCETVQAKYGTGGNNVPIVNNNVVVRRLTPTECERLQGYPDGWTLIGEPEEVEVKDYQTTYDEEGNVIEKKQVGTHTEIEYFYKDSNGKRKKCSDSSRYKALGNSIALPFWEWMAKRMAKYIESETPTMASLFDGIGGFPLVYQRAGVTPVWASEIEEFPIAVTKVRFPKGVENEA